MTITLDLKHKAVINVHTDVTDIAEVDGVITAYNANSDVVILDESAVATEVAKLKTAYDNNAYQRDRAVAYPSMADQLDDIYHNGVDEWKKTIKAIKDKYPKE